MSLRRFLTTLLALGCLSSLCPSRLQAHEAGQQMVDTATALLKALPAEARTKALYPFESEERFNWHFVPRERNGLSFKEMPPEARLLGHALLTTGLSYRGYVKATTIMSLEEVLFGIEGADPAKRDAARARRDPEKYFISIFGEPSMKGVWGWRLEGHHLALNFTVKDGSLFRSTPCFFGSNPGEIRQGPRTGVRPLSAEEDLGRQLAKSLNDDQWKMALIQETAFKDILTEAKRQVSPLSPDGLSDAELNADQKTQLQTLLKEHLFRIRPEVAEAAWQELLASGPIHFAWAGSREPSQGHYYRIQGKSFVVEYDNTQNNANHVHTAWRDFDSDFGLDLLGEHVKTAHQPTK
ncbi:DUF3500 domain-containing protein [Verrucomicrobium spinosum]|uniref:DUF3500 domain-containing protein n=1 Tax=Verrucomicrobium spinosum TaxID=2736 RepID=UPI00017446F3|nr:DUF3500 domain-containing protein [Verrucomicrobium spinosum]